MRNWFKIFLPLAVVLIGIVIAQKINSSRLRQIPQSLYLQKVSKINETAIDRVSLKDKNGELVLIKNGEDWLVNNKKVDGNKVKQILDIILDREGYNYDLISQNLNRAEEFGLATTSARRVVLNSGSDEVLAVSVGLDSYPGTFIKIGNATEVYLTRQSLGSLINSDPSNLDDKSNISQ